MPQIIDTEEAKKQSSKELLGTLTSNTQNGLDQAEADKRLQEYGSNEILEKKQSPLLKFLGYFWGPIPWMIEVAAILSVVIKHWEDFWIILALLLLNAIVGFWQEYSADNAIEALKEKLALNARVLRNGKWTQIKASLLVPGDIIRVRLGDKLPADLKLLEGDYLMTDESALTGESLPVEKHGEDIAYAGSIARQGEMTGLVTSTGMNTFFGKTAKLVESAQTKSHFQKAIIKIGNYLIFLAIALVIVIFLMAMFRHESLLETFQFALVLTVAAIPVALPAVLSVTLAVGATALAKKEAIVSKLVAIEEMAGVDILCSDKTGTITKNELSVGEVTPFENFKKEDVLTLGMLASKEENADPIDKAIEDKAKETNISISAFTNLNFKPFDPVSKRTEATIEGGDKKQFKVAKGAPQSILSLTGDDGTTGQKLKAEVNRIAEKGYRALGVARTDDNGKWHYAGVIGLFDPAREDSASTIATAQQMGMQVKMVTGDHVAIAKEIAGQVGLNKDIIEPEKFIKVPDRQAQTIVEKAGGFAQVFPEHKFHIVELLQKSGHIVGMTGDGVNDAPALKKADVGIAVAGATDAAKSAADIVLTRPGLSVIIDAIKQSRKIFQRMTNYAIYRIAETIRVLLFITFSIIVFRFYPVTALMIVLLALLNDAPIMTIAADRVHYSNAPERWNMRSLLSISTMLGIVGVISSFGILYIGRDVLHLSREVLQSFIYLKLSVAGHLTVFVARTRKNFWTVKPSRPLFLAVVITQCIATLITVYGILLPAMGWKLAGLVWGYAIVLFVITDFLKVWFYKLIDRERI